MTSGTGARCASCNFILIWVSAHHQFSHGPWPHGWDAAEAPQVGFLTRGQVTRAIAREFEGGAVKEERDGVKHGKDLWIQWDLMRFNGF